MSSYLMFRFYLRFLVGIDWNTQGQLYLHQDYIFLTYARSKSATDSAICSVDFKEVRLLSKRNVLLPSWTISVGKNQTNLQM